MDKKDEKTKLHILENFKKEFKGFILIQKLTAIQEFLNLVQFAPFRQQYHS